MKGLKGDLMRKKICMQKNLALGMSLVMFCTTPVYAQESQKSNQVKIQENSQIENEDASGTCGPDVKWTLDRSTGTLFISGQGKMYDYKEDDDFPGLFDAPWYYEDFKNVVIAPGCNKYRGLCLSCL